MKGTTTQDDATKRIPRVGGRHACPSSTDIPTEAVGLVGGGVLLTHADSAYTSSGYRMSGSGSGIPSAGHQDERDSVDSDAADADGPDMGEADDDVPIGQDASRRFRKLAMVVGAIIVVSGLAAAGTVWGFGSGLANQSTRADVRPATDRTGANPGGPASIGSPPMGSPVPDVAHQLGGNGAPSAGAVPADPYAGYPGTGTVPPYDPALNPPAGPGGFASPAVPPPAPSAPLPDDDLGGGPASDDGSTPDPPMGAQSGGSGDSVSSPRTDPRARRAPDRRSPQKPLHGAVSGLGGLGHL
jgi:hypothetical protein